MRSDEQLMAAYVDGDSGAFGELFERYAPMLHRMVGRRIRQPEDVSELVQSNDLFLAPSDGGLPLFDDQGMALSGDITMHVMLWNAGTEIDQAPGAGPDQAPRQSGPDTGAAEAGAVELVQDEAWPAPEQVLRVTLAAE